MALLAGCSGPTGDSSGTRGGDSLDAAAEVAPLPTPITPAPEVSDPGPTRAQRRARELRRAAEVAAAEEKAAKKQARRQAEKRAERVAARAALNPLAGRTWGVYQGPREPTSEPYQRATGATKEALATIALEPKAAWFGAWIADAEIGARGLGVHRRHPAGRPRGTGADDRLPDGALGARGLQPATDHGRADVVPTLDRLVRSGGG